MRAWLQSIWRVIKGLVSRPRAEEPPAPFVPAEPFVPLPSEPRLVYHCPKCQSPVFLFQEWCRRCGTRQPSNRPDPRTRAERLDEWQ